MTPSRDIARLIEIMAALRDKEMGCAWDVAQTSDSIANYAIEEAYEVVDAIRRGDTADLCDELGDLLLQVVFHARMNEEAGHFAFGDVVEAITAKMIRRHPHVFGTRRDMSPEEVKRVWQEIKAQEKAERAARRGASDVKESVLDGVPLALPALERAERISRKAAAVGFDWDHPEQVIGKIAEELDECREALEGGEREALEGEIGDLLFAVVNLARKADIDPSAALERTNAKFMARFQYIERRLAEQNIAVEAASLEDMERLWGEAKATSF